MECDCYLWEAPWLLSPSPSLSPCSEGPPAWPECLAALRRSSKKWGHRSTKTPPTFPFLMRKGPSVLTTLNKKKRIELLVIPVLFIWPCNHSSVNMWTDWGKNPAPFIELGDDVCNKIYFSCLLFIECLYFDRSLPSCRETTKQPQGCAVEWLSWAPLSLEVWAQPPLQKAWQFSDWLALSGVKTASCNTSFP